IYFEELIYYRNKYIRSQNAKIERPITPQSLPAFIREVSNLIRWRDAIVAHLLQF
ncbi:uncharacterized protein B0P05DRAFT_467993, partial [Gilbertella persicaria]|uniref:uncharacterized protein n=1 Tax=Gilbertella persicaria TaxID=101096 RepID=UPI002220D2EA